MKIFILFITIIFYSSNLISQEQRAEQIFQECLYNSLPDNGIFFKNQIVKFEKSLIKKEILKDACAQSYYMLYTKIQSGEDLSIDFEYSFKDSIASYSVEYLNLARTNLECQEILQKSPSFKATKLNVNSFSADDFELDFYKIAILFIIEEYKVLSDLEKKFIENNKD